MKQITIIIFLSAFILALLVAIAGYFWQERVIENQQKLINEVYQAGQIDLISYQQQQGVYLYFTNQSGSVTLQSKTLNEICGEIG